MEIFRCLSGSRLYGTNLPESDTDYKAVHLPTRPQILLGKGEDHVNSSTGDATSSNSASDVDMESIRLQRFLQLAGEMQPIAVELLFATPIVRTRLWDEIVLNRHKIINAKTGPFIGYCRSQANRYSVRGERLEAFTAVCDVLSGLISQNSKAIDYLPLPEELNNIPGVVVADKINPGGVAIPTLTVYGRQAALTCSVKDVYDIMLRPVKDAGKRSKDAHAAGGADWKAMYHAVRIAQEGIDLFTKGELIFPCEEASLLLRIRNGELQLDEVLDIFESKMVRMEDAAEHTQLPKYQDYEWINDFLLGVHAGIVLGG